MPAKAHWDSRFYPPVLHRAMAIYMNIVATLPHMKEQARLGVMPETETVVVLFQIDDDNDLVFHAGDLDGLWPDAMGALLNDYIEKWDTLSEEECLAKTQAHLPVGAFRPIVVNELEAAGFREELFC